MLIDLLFIFLPFLIYGAICAAPYLIAMGWYKFKKGYNKVEKDQYEKGDITKCDW